MPTVTQGNPSREVFLDNGRPFNPTQIAFSPAMVLGSGTTVTISYQPVGTNWWIVLPGHKAIGTSILSADGYSTMINARVSAVRVVANTPHSSCNIPFEVA